MRKSRIAAISSDQQSDDFLVERIQRVLDTGLGDHLLLSPALPRGGTPKPFTYLSESFLPKLRQAGVDEPTILQLTQSNPFRAFAR